MVPLYTVVLDHLLELLHLLDYVLSLLSHPNVVDTSDDNDLKAVGKVEVVLH